MTIEVAVEGIHEALSAAQAGAHRLEVCSALSEGGLTPSYATLERIAKSVSIPCFAMIRPRGGGFVYTPEELDIMERDIEMAAAAGCKGVVFGCLTEKGKLDVPGTGRLTVYAQDIGLEVTFHRAIDLVKEPLFTVDLLCTLGVNHILSSGCRPNVVDGAFTLMTMVQKAGGRASIIAGGGVLPQNAETIADAGVQGLHFNARRAADSPGSPFSFGHDFSPWPEKITAIREALGL
jgi:copper homeostasis protein